MSHNINTDDDDIFHPTLSLFPGKSKKGETPACGPTGVICYLALHPESPGTSTEQLSVLPPNILSLSGTGVVRSQRERERMGAFEVAREGRMSSRRKHSEKS